MMGTGNSDQSQFFYSFNPEDHVPKNHLLRGIDQFLDLSDLRPHLANFYSKIGRPSKLMQISICPAGKSLRSNRNKSKNPGQVTKKNTIIYRASQPVCDVCPMKPKCCPAPAARKIARSIHEDARDVARGLLHTEAYNQSRKDRKKVEMLFGHLKRILNLNKVRLRGFSGANDEFLLAATAQNLRRIAQWLGKRPPIYQ